MQVAYLVRNSTLLAETAAADLIRASINILDGQAEELLATIEVTGIPVVEEGWSLPSPG